MSRRSRNPGEEWRFILDGMAESFGVDSGDVEFTPELVQEIEAFENLAQVMVDACAARFPPKEYIIVDSSKAYDIYQTLAGEGVGIWDGRWDEFYPSFSQKDWDGLTKCLAAKLGKFVDVTGGGTLPDLMVAAVDAVAPDDAVVAVSTSEPGGKTRSAVEAINRSRHRLLQPPLDLSGWSEDDILEFAEHIPNPTMSDFGEITSIKPHEVFVRVSSHRARGQVERRLGPLQGYYTMKKRVPAATSHYVMTDGEFHQVKGIKGVARARFRRQDAWQPSISVTMHPMAPSKNPKTPPTLKVGDLVTYTTSFARSIGIFTKQDAVVVGHGTIGPWVVWNDDDFPVQVNAFNLRKVKTTRSARDLVLAAKLATGLPLGTPHGGYWFYTRNGGAFKRAGGSGSRANAEKRGVKLHDETGKDLVILTQDGHVMLAMRGFATNPSHNPAERTFSSLMTWR